MERFALSNGLSVVLQRDARQPTVVGAVAYRVGHRDDPPDYRGLAHLVEHMAFRGSRNLPKHAAIEQYAAIGAFFGGMTMRDHTIYYAEFLGRHLPHFLWVESERMAFTLEAMDESVLEVERKVVLNEYLERIHQRYITLVVNRTTTPPGHPYQILGEAWDHPDDLGFEDVRSFFQRHYRPDNATLVLIGQLDLAATRALIDKYFGPIVAVGSLAPRPAAPAIVYRGSQRLRFSVAGGFSEVRARWSVPCRRDTACHAQLGLLASLIERALAPESLGAAPFRDPSVDLETAAEHVEVDISVRIPPEGRADDALAWIDRVLDRIRSGKIAAQVLRSAQHARATQLLYAHESLVERALRLIVNPELLDEPAIQEAGRMTVREISAAARNLLPADRRLVLEIRRDRDAKLQGELEDSEGELSPVSVSAPGPAAVKESP